MQIAAKVFYLSLAISAATILTASNVSAACVTSEERDAHHIRSLQTQMMVGALQCRGRRDMGQRELYNIFVRSHQAELASFGKILIGHFRRMHGEKFKTMLDKHVTNLANSASSASRDVPDFCHEIAMLGESLDAGADLLDAALKTPIELAPDYPLCPADRKTAALR